MARRVGWVGLVALMIAMAVLACRQLVGVTDDPPTDLTSTLCGLPYATNECASCANTNCCAESTACAADSLFCAPYESCLGSCNGDPACRSQCTIEHPVPVENAAPVSALSACLAAKCKDACRVACGGVAGYISEPDAAAGCQSCIQKNACAQASACGTSVECDGLWRCNLACTTADCRAACSASYDAGMSLARDFYQEYSTVCATSCDYGGYWTCAGTFHQWPAAQSATVNLTWWVSDFSTQMGVPSAKVSICGNCPCGLGNSPIFASGFTDANGYFTLPVPQTVMPDRVAYTLCLQVTKSDYMTTFQYFGFPLSAPTVSIRDVLQPATAYATALVTVSSQMANETGLGTTYDPTRGVIGVGVWDCLSGTANDVDVSLDGGDEGTLALGVVDAGPNALLTGLSGGSVSGPGRVIFLNVPPGTVTLTATPRLWASPLDQISVNVAAGTLTQVGMYPSPSP